MDKLGKINKTYYNKKYDKYSNLKFSSIYKKRLINKILIQNHLKKNKISILDLGCGDGTTLKLFHKNCILYGIDFSKKAIFRAKKKLKKYTNYKIMLFDLENITQLYLSQKYDLIICSHIFEHLNNYKLVLDWIIKNTKKHVIIGIPINESEKIKLHNNNFKKKEFLKLLSKYKNIKTIYNSNIGSVELIFEWINKNISLFFFKKLFLNTLSVIVSFIPIFDDLFKLKRNQYLIIEIINNE